VKQESQRKRDALVHWLRTGEEPEDAQGHVDAYDQSAWYIERRDGKTVCCLAGAACVWWGNDGEFMLYKAACDHFGFDHKEAFRDDIFASRKGVSANAAASVFLNYCKTGKTGWERSP